MKNGPLSTSKAPDTLSGAGMPIVFTSHMRRDGAAPLIGSSAVMQAVRDRIERVAATDFIALIEGAIDRK